RAAVVTYGATLAILGALVAIGARHAFALERELYWTRASGWTALGALLCSLCATPVGRVLGRVRPRAERAVAPWRRALGVTAAATASLHAGLALSTYLGGSLDPIADYPWLRGGALALAILWALWLTSYPRVVRALRVKLWKPLHRLAFVAALLALQHVLLAPMAPVGWVLGVFGAAAAVGLLRLVPRRP
ncbi:MAG TPA: ferric reductase-like transmembrane domain-containing protein, partial [Sandaracinaceae bacterium LLY-WYZ-13_1]|nr:ferric reductase-like transmembrane domain-containing protein [Sandaracinaceae bacterium LLY-WYZ-13_1]